MLPFQLIEYPQQLLQLYIPADSVIEVDILNEYNTDAHVVDINITCNIPNDEEGERSIDVTTEQAAKVNWKPLQLTEETLDKKYNSLLRYWTPEHPPFGTINVPKGDYIVWSWGNLTNPPTIDCSTQQRMESGIINVSKLMNGSSSSGLIVILFCNEKNNESKSIENKDINSITEYEPAIEESPHKQEIHCNNKDPIEMNNLLVTSLSHKHKLYISTGNIYFSDQYNDLIEFHVQVSPRNIDHRLITSFIAGVGIFINFLFLLISVFKTGKDCCCANK